MKISPAWLFELVDLSKVITSPGQIAGKLSDDLTLAGIAVETVIHLEAPFEHYERNRPDVDKLFESLRNRQGHPEPHSEYWNDPAFFQTVLDSTIFEMEITTNRPDAMNHYGVARECSAIYDVPLKEIEPKLRETKREPLKESELKIDTFTAAGRPNSAVRVTHIPSGTVVSSIDKKSVEENRDEALRKLSAQLHPDFPIEIADPQLCGRYSARVVCDVKIGPSPKKIADRLLIEDHHGINNVADATNYVLMEMGHPTHAFDLDLLEGGRIIVRLAKPGEILKTL